MSKKQFKAQASSSRAFSAGGAFGSSLGGGSAFGSASSPLSYLAEQPDLTAVSDPNVVVNFKNLSKKDSSTKSKALEDLSAYVGSLIEQKQELEEAFLEAWVGKSFIWTLGIIVLATRKSCSGLHQNMTLMVITG